MMNQIEKVQLQQNLIDIPKKLVQLIAPISAEDRTTPQIEGEWSIAQNVHHIVDVAVLFYTRIRCILTEENPLLLSLSPTEWVMLPDANSADNDTSIAILQTIHQSFADYTVSLTEEQLARSGYDAHHKKIITIESVLTRSYTHVVDHLIQIQEQIDQLN